MLDLSSCQEEGKELSPRKGNILFLCLHFTSYNQTYNVVTMYFINDQKGRVSHILTSLYLHCEAAQLLDLKNHNLRFSRLAVKNSK